MQRPWSTVLTAGEHDDEAQTGVASDEEEDNDAVLQDRRASSLHASTRDEALPGAGVHAS